MKLASFQALIRALHDAEARYLIAGGMAVGAHGYLRFTRGVDLVARLVPDNVERVFSALCILGYRPAVPVTAEEFADSAYRQSRFTEQGIGALGFMSDRHQETPINVFAQELFSFDEEYRKALVKPLNGAFPVRFVCIETLIRMKEASGRLADRADADQLRLTLEVDEPLNLQPGEIDWRLTTWEGSRKEQLRRWAMLPLERAVQALEEMEELTERFQEARERGGHTAPSASSSEREAHAPLAPAAGEVEDVSCGMETGNRTLASASPGREGADPPQPDSAERGREHGVRGGAGGSRDAGGGARSPGGAARYVQTRFGILSYSELAPHLARNVLALELKIDDGAFAQEALGDALLFELDSLICGDLVPQLAGWRKTNVTIGAHSPPEYVRVPLLVREYGLDLQARLSAVGGGKDETLLETLAFAEGRLLSIHPFADFSGRVTRVWLREILRRLDLPPVRLVPNGELERDEYVQALRAGDRNEWEPLMEVWRRRFEEGAA